MPNPFEYLNATLGLSTDAEATGNGTLTAILKRLRTLLNGGLPGALGAGGGLKIEGVAGGVTIPISSAGGIIAQTPTVTAGAYSANDNVGGLLTFASAARATGGGGVIKDVIIIDDASQGSTLELWIFSATFTAGSDNAAWTPVEADLENLVAIVSTADGVWYSAGATATVCVIEVAKRYQVAATSLFGRLVTRGTPTYAATDDVTVKTTLLKD